MNVGQELSFKYSALFQSAIVKFTCSQTAMKTILCEASVQLPILKKKYLTCTDYPLQGALVDWLVHTPIHEPGAMTPKISKTADLENVFDPVSFFMQLHEGEWSAPTVRMLVGAKIIELEVNKKPEGYQIKRHDKDQELFVRKDAGGIKSLEIPIPVIGTLKLQRV